VDKERFYWLFWLLKLELFVIWFLGWLEPICLPE
jgi:hypothetical protein